MSLLFSRTKRGLLAVTGTTATTKGGSSIPRLIGGSKIVELYPQLRKSIQNVQQTVLGYAPPSYQNKRTGYQFCKKQLTAIYLVQYYQDYSIDKVAKLTNPGFLTEEEERRKEKLAQLRRRGKGPPKKGSGKRSKKR